MAWQIHSLWPLTRPVFLVLGNILAIFISPRDNLLDNMSEGHVSPHGSHWNKRLSVSTVVATEVLWPQLQCHLSQKSWAADQQNKVTVRQSDCSVYWELLQRGHMDSTRLITSKWTYGWYQADYFKVDVWMVPGWLLQSGHMDGARLITSKWTYG